MKTYIVERMTTANFHRYMMGAYDCSVETLYIEAETVAEAIEKASADGYEVNKNYVKTTEEVEAERIANEIARAEYEAKEAAKKARRIATEARKAAEMGMTVEEYRRHNRREATKRALAHEIEAMEKELARKRAVLAKMMGE